MSLFKELYHLNVNENTEQVQGLTYLSWAWAWAEIKKVDEKASVKIHEFPMLTADLQVVEGITVPYLKTPEGYFVKVSVTIQGHTETEILPVMDNKNVPLGTIAPVWVKKDGASKAVKEFGPTPAPTSFDINKSHKRCMVKAIALHGLGLYIYAGEDVPEKDEAVTKAQEEERQNFIGMIRGLEKEVGELATQAIRRIETHSSVRMAVEQMGLEWLEKTYKVVKGVADEHAREQKKTPVTEDAVAKAKEKAATGKK